MENKEPTQEEIQELVNQVYGLAADLHFNQSKSWDEVKQKLVEEGLEEKYALAIVANLKRQEIEANRDAASKEIGYGVLWTIGGIVLTAITRGHLIFYGAIIWGVWLIIKGVWHKMQ